MSKKRNKTARACRGAIELARQLDLKPSAVDVRDLKDAESGIRRRKAKRGQANHE